MKRTLAGLMTAITLLHGTTQAVYAADLESIFNNSFITALNQQQYFEKDQEFFEDCLQLTGNLYSAVWKASQEGTEGEVSISLTLGEKGKAIVKQLLLIYARALADPSVYEELAWIDSLQITWHTRTQGLQQLHCLDLEFNENRTLSLESYLDPDTCQLYFRIPDLSHRYLSVDLKNLFPEQLLDTLTLLDGQLAALPEPAVMQELIDRYGTYFHENATVYSPYRFYRSNDLLQHVTIDGKTMDVRLIQASFIPYSALQIPALLSEDAQLKELYTSWAENTELPSYDVIMDELQELPPETIYHFDYYPLHSLWLDSDTGEILGHGLGFQSGSYSYFPGIHYISYESNGKSYFCLTDFDEFALKGSGLVEDGLLDGTYLIEVEEEPVCQFTVEDFDPAALQQGIWKGTYTLDLDSFDSYGTGVLSNTHLILTADGSEEEFSLRLDLIDEDDLIASLSLKAGAGDGLEYPNPPDLRRSIDVGSSTLLQAFLGSIDTSRVEAHLAESGASEGFLQAFTLLKNQLISFLS